MFKTIFVGTGIILNIILVLFFCIVFAIGFMRLPYYLKKIRDIGELSGSIHNEYYKELKNYNVRLYEDEKVIIIIAKDSKYEVNLVRKENK